MAVYDLEMIKLLENAEKNYKNKKSDLYLKGPYLKR